MDKTQLTYDCLQTLAVFDLWEIERELNLLQTDPEILWRPFASLSGGEQTKVLLALLFIDDRHFPLIDEPTNHLDITARQQVANYLKAKRNGFIVVSHDRSFVNEIVDHVLSIEKVNWYYIKETLVLMKSKKKNVIVMNRKKIVS